MKINFSAVDFTFQFFRSYLTQSLWMQIHLIKFAFLSRRFSEESKQKCMRFANKFKWFALAFIPSADRLRALHCVTTSLRPKTTIKCGSPLVHFHSNDPNATSQHSYKWYTPKKGREWKIRLFLKCFMLFFVRQEIFKHKHSISREEILSASKEKTKSQRFVF